ncbi:MAG: DUF1697 domain-containing protein [Maribacter sp.]|nr:DUF1697 domain-containing protein [Maribacter sp.]
MITYIALLRGINVGGHKKIKMADFRLLLKGLGYKEVLTYIQSGNVVFKSKVTDHRKLENEISKAIKKQYEFDVAVIVKTKTELVNILKNNPFNDLDDLAANKIYFVLLKDIPQKRNIEMASIKDFENEQFFITPECIFVRYALGAGKAKCGVNYFESKLKVDATARNYRTMMKLVELSSS